MEIRDIQSVALSHNEIKMAVMNAVNSGKLKVKYNYNSRVMIDSSIDYFEFKMYSKQSERFHEDSYNSGYEAILLGNRLIEYEVKLISSKFIINFEECSRIFLEINENVELIFEMNLDEFILNTKQKVVVYSSHEKYDLDAEQGYLIAKSLFKDINCETLNSYGGQVEIRDLLIPQGLKKVIMKQMIINNPKDTYMEINTKNCITKIHIQDNEREIYHHFDFSDYDNGKIDCYNSTYFNRIVISNNILYRVTMHNKQKKYLIKCFLVENEMIVFKLDESIYMYFYDANREYFDNFSKGNICRDDLGDVIDKNADMRRYSRGFQEERYDCY